MALSKHEKARMEWRDKLRINYKLIVEDSRLGDLLDDFYSDQIFSEEERETIAQFDGLENEKNRKFLDILMMKDASSFKRFLMYLDKTGRDDLANTIENTNVSKKPKTTSTFVASADWKEKILRNYKTIVHQSDLERLLDSLYSAEVFTDEEKHKVKAQKTIFEKNRLILRILLRKTQHDFDLLLECFRETKNNELADLIDNTSVTETPMYTNQIQDIEELKLRRRIFRIRQQIIDDANLEEFLDDFVTNRVLEVDDIERLRNIIPQQKKNQEILDMIFRKSYNCFSLLLQLLEDNVELLTEMESIIVDESVEKEIKDTYFLSMQTDIIPVAKRDQVNVQLSSWKENIYVEVHATRTILEMARQGTILTITGNSGTGKTATNRFVALKLADYGYDVLPLSDLNEMMKYLHPGYKQVFVIDNPVGSQNLDENELELWVKQNEVLRNLKVENTKVLCSIRKEIILAKAFKKSNSALNINVIDLQDPSHLLTIEEKVQILRSHLGDQSYNIGDEMKTVIAKVDESFPLLCTMFSSNKDFQKSQDEFFKDPYILFKKDLDEMSREKYCVLILCLCHAPLMARDFIETDETADRNRSHVFGFAKILNACNLQPSVPIEGLKEHLDTLTQVYLKKEALFYDFSHDMMRDVVACHFGNSKQLSFLTICPSEQIRDLVSVDTSEISNRLNKIIINRQNIPDLLLRLLTDIQKGEYNPAILHSCWDDELVLRVFVDMLGDRRMILKCFRTDVLDIFCKDKYKLEKIGNKKEEEKKKEDESEESDQDDDGTSVEDTEGKRRNAIDSWTWHYTTMRCLELKGVTAVHWIAAFSRRRLFNIIWRNLSEKQKRQIEAEVPLLHFAFIGGDREICTSLMERDDGKSCIPLSRHGVGVTNFLPIHFAVMKNSNAEDFLIQRQVNVDDMVSREGYTPLFIAVSYGNSSMVQKLITKYRSDVNKCSREGWSPLMISVQNSHNDITKILLDHNAKVDFADRIGWNPLHVAVSNNNIEAVSLLLERGARVDHGDKENRTPLLKSVQKGFVEVTQLLLSYKANVKKRNKNGNCALHIAAQNNDVRIAEILFTFNKTNACLDIEVPNKYGNCPLQIAVKNESNDVAEVLIQHKANVENRDTKGKTPLINAVSKGNYRLAETLINNGADINTCSNSGSSPLQIAVQENHIHFTKLLLHRGADINLPDGKWVSPLQKALSFGHIDMAEILIENSADVNQYNVDGVTPLMITAHQGEFEIASLLIEKGADKTAQDNEGNYAYNFTDSMKMIQLVADSVDDSGVEKHVKAIKEKKLKKATLKIGTYHAPSLFSFQDLAHEPFSRHDLHSNPDDHNYQFDGSDSMDTKYDGEDHIIDIKDAMLDTVDGVHGRFDIKDLMLNRVDGIHDRPNVLSKIKGT